MIKKILLGLGINLLFFIGFSSAYFYPTIDIDLPGNFYYGGTDFNSISSALNLSSDNGRYLHIIDNGFRNNEYRVFWNNGKLYLYGYYGYFDDYTQGYFVKFCKAIGTGYCSDGYSINVGNEFYNLSGVNFTNFIGSFQGETSSPGFCFYNSNNNTNYCTEVIDELGNTTLTGSLNILNGEDNFSSYAQYSPFFTTAGLPSVNINCPTVGQLINGYNNDGFSSGLCYTSSRIYSGNSFVSMDPVSIFDLFPTESDYFSALSDFGNYCESSVYDRSVCYSAFQGKDLQFNLLSKIPRDLDVIGKRKQLYLYCSLYDYDLNTTTCVGSGILPEIGKEYNRNDLLTELQDGTAVIVSPNQDGVFSGGNFSWSGDIISNIQNLFVTFTGLFRKQTSNTIGFLPSYIIGAFLLIILFKLFKK